MPGLVLDSPYSQAGGLCSRQHHPQRRAKTGGLILSTLTSNLEERQLGRDTEQCKYFPDPFVRAKMLLSQGIPNELYLQISCI